MYAVVYSKIFWSCTLPVGMKAAGVLLLLCGIIGRHMLPSFCVYTHIGGPNYRLIMSTLSLGK